MKFLKRNIVTILCIGILIVVTFIEFDTYKARILFISTLMFFVGGMLFVTFLSKYIFLRYSGKEIIFLLKYHIIIWTISAIILVFPGGLKYTGAYLLGLSIYTVFVLGYYWIRFGRKKKDLMLS